MAESDEMMVEFVWTRLDCDLLRLNSLMFCQILGSVEVARFG